MHFVAFLAGGRLGFFGDGDIVVMLIGPDKNRNFAVVRYVQVFNSESATGEIERVCKELKSTLEGLEKK